MDRECQTKLFTFSDLAGGKSLSLCGGPPQLHGDTGVGWPTYFQKISILHIGCSWQVLVFREDGEQGAEECAARRGEPGQLGEGGGRLLVAASLASAW